MLKAAEEWKLNASLRLREVYYAKIEWVRKANFQIERRSRSELKLSPTLQHTLDASSSFYKALNASNHLS
jgi:hypothetical protein